MPYRMTSNAPTVGQFVARLDALANTYIDAVIEIGALAVEGYAPRDRGHLVAWLKRHKREGSGFTAWGWVGPLTGLDINESVRGKGYLRQFVEDHIGANAYRPYWDALNTAEKDALQAGRETGSWGGAVIDAMYAPRYMAAVDRGIVPKGAAGFHAQHKGFVQRILDRAEIATKGLVQNLPTDLARPIRTDYA